jgi:hypothetical protein
MTAAELPAGVAALLGGFVVCMRECIAASFRISANERDYFRDGVANPHIRRSSRNSDAGSTLVTSR